MYKILLLYPSLLNAASQETTTLYTDIPLSIVTLAAQFHQSDYEVDIVDERLEEISASDLARKLQNTVMVGISAITSYQIVNGLRAIERIKRIDNQIPIVWGGWHASLMPEETIRHPLVDMVMVGQGEANIRKLADCLRDHRALDEIPNLLYKNQDGTVVKTTVQRDPNFQMQTNLIHGYENLSMERYIHSAWGNKRILGYESSRGCPYGCSFCSISAVFQQKWYGLPADNVYRDLRWLYDHYSIDAVHFFDNNFFVDKARALTLAQLLGDHSPIRWDGTVAIRQFIKFTKQEIHKLKAGGLYRIIAGVESGDEEVLAKINKKHTNEQVLELVHRCREEGLQPSLSFMMGFPWNPEQDTERTMRLIEQIREILPGTEILLFVFSPYLGTPLYRAAIEYGMKFPTSLDGWANFTYDAIQTPWISRGLARKMGRYLQFFETKVMPANEESFFKRFT